MKYHVLTLGCKVNQYESDQVSKQLLAGGFQQSELVEEADLIIINTCSVTHVADRKGRQLIRKTEKANPNAKIIITGCSAENATADLPEVKNGLFIKKNDLAEKIDELFGAKPNHGLVLEERKSRKFILIQNGCNYFCSYCIIPYVRNNIYSVSPNDIRIQITHALKLGVKEFVLTGINLGTYNYQEKNLLALLKDITSIPGEYRIRLSSIEPNLVSEDLLEFIDATPKIAPHLHIPLQGGSNALLNAMKRRYKLEDYLTLLDNIDKLHRNVSVTADLIIGFPTETKEDIESTLKLLSSGKFMNFHLFAYSPRKGTPAFDIKPTFSSKQKKARMSESLAAAKENKTKYLKQFIGETSTVLIEEQKGDYQYGYSENYFKVRIPKPDGSILNQFVDCKLVSIFETDNTIGLEGALI